MSIDKLVIEGAVVPQSEQVQTIPEGVGRDNNQHADPAEGFITSDQVFLSGSVAITYNELQFRNEQQNSIAGSIREADRLAGELGQKIDALKEPLESIVKNFPPFAPDDEERKKLLMSYSSIRKEIDHLTFPPPPEVLKERKAVELPPALPMTAGDSQIADHLSELEGVADSLGRLRDDLEAGKALILEDDGLAILLSEKKRDKWEPRDPLTEVTASEVSAEVGRQFAEFLNQGVTANEHTHFLKELS